METPQQKEKRLTKILKKLEASRVDKVQELIQWSYDDLEELEKVYWEASVGQKEEGNILSAEVIRMRYWIVNEAIMVKRGNEEQAWDYLT